MDELNKERTKKEIERKQRIKASKEEQIMSILLDENLSYGMVMDIVDRVVANLRRDGDTYLRKTKIVCISPKKD